MLRIERGAPLGHEAAPGQVCQRHRDGTSAAPWSCRACSIGSPRKRARMRSAFMFECLPWLGPMPTVEKRLSSSLLSKPSCAGVLEVLDLQVLVEIDEVLAARDARKIGYGCDGHRPADARAGARGRAARRGSRWLRRHRHRAPSAMRVREVVDAVDLAAGEEPAGQRLRHELLDARRS